MAADFLRSLFRRAPAPNGEVADALDQLQRLRQERPTLNGPCDLLADLLPALFAAKPLALEINISAERAGDKLATGVPVLRDENVTADESDLTRRWLRISDAVIHHQNRDAGRRVGDAVREGKLRPSDLLRALLSEEPTAVRLIAEQHDCDADLTGTILRFTLLPALSQLNNQFAGLRPGRAWEAGFCPTCGSWPLLGEFRGLEQTRFLRCGWCAAQWELPRLHCPFCGNRQHETLGYLHVENEETKYRAATCDVCHGYVKMVNSLSGLSLTALLVADVATLHLDLIAAERGYAPPL